MNPVNRISLILGLVAMMLLMTAIDADAQRRGSSRGGGRPVHDEKIDITAMYGHMWGGNMDVVIGSTRGKIRLGTAPSLFFAVNIPVGPARWVELNYDHQGGELKYDQGLSGTSTLSDLSINYWHIGVVQGMPRGNVIPYGTFGLGVTYYSPSEDRFELDGDEYALDTATKFSLSLGLGVKAFFGEAERFGIRAHFRTMPTFYNTGAGLWFGTGGAGLSVSGYGIWQWEVAGGVTIRLG
jgi:hypothetical protein